MFRRWVALLLCLYAARGTSVLALGCVDYSQHPEPVASLALPGGTWSVATRDGFAYVATLGGLFVLDISNPREPTLVGSLPEPCMLVTVVDTLAYVGSWDLLHIVDISDPAAPVILGTVTTPNRPRAVAVAGNFAFVAAPNLLVYDVGDPTTPVLVSSSASVWATGLAVAGDRLYLAASPFLKVLDVRDPANPVVLGRKDLGNAVNVALKAEVAYVANGGSGLAVVDVADPGLPRLLGSVDTPGFAGAVCLGTDFAYIVDGSTSNQYSSDLCAIDVSIPERPSLVGSVETPGSALGLALSGKYAFVADGPTGVQVIDVEEAVSTAILSHLDTSGTALAIAVAGDFAYMAGHGAGLLVVDIRERQMPRLVASIDTPGFARGVEVDGAHAYVLDSSTGILVFDLTDPSTPVLAGSIAMPNAELKLQLQGRYGYVAVLGYGLRVVDFFDPTKPVIVGSLDVGLAQCLAVAGNIVYLADAEILRVIDVVNPVAPRAVNSVRLPELVEEILVSGDFAYAAARSSGLVVVDVTAARDPVVLGSIDTGRLIKNVYAAEPYVYVTEGYSVRVIDVRNPAAPTSVGVVVLDRPRDVCVDAQGVYVAGGYSSLVVLRPQCSTTPITLSSFTVSAMGADVEVRWTTAELNSRTAFHLRARCTSAAWEVPFLAERRGSFRAADRPPRSCAAGSIVYSLLGREPGGDWVLLAEEPLVFAGEASQSRLLGPAPNPLRAPGTLRFELANPAMVRLSLHDASGREIVRLLQRFAPAGASSLVWDGRDAHGKPVPAGVYFVRLESPDGVRSRKLVLAR